MNLTKKEILLEFLYWLIQILPDFCRFYSFLEKKINVFKLKSPILDMWWFQNSHLTLINENKL